MKLSNYIEITGIIFSEQGNKKGRNNWMKKLHEVQKAGTMEDILHGARRPPLRMVDETHSIKTLTRRTP